MQLEVQAAGHRAPRVGRKAGPRRSVLHLPLPRGDSNGTGSAVYGPLSATTFRRAVVPRQNSHEGSAGMRNQSENGGHLMVAVCLLVVLLGGGCTTVKSTGTSRSGTEQLLLTGAWDSALCPVDFRPIAGRRVYVDSQFVSVTDKEWVVSSLRRRMAEQGVLLENDKAKAELIVEPSLGAYGTDERNCTFGLPSGGIFPALLSPASLLVGGAASTSNASGMTLTQSNKSDAVVKAAVFAYDAKSGHLVWESGPMLNAHGVRDRYFVGAGPYRISSLREVESYPAEAQYQATHRVGGE